MKRKEISIFDKHQEEKNSIFDKDKKPEHKKEESKK